LLGAGTADGGLAPASSPSRGSAAPQKPPVPTPSAPGAGTSDARSLAADPKADDLRNPARLAACLGALGVSPDRLVAVDLATYDGREAAILLATSADGAGHEVWAVERTCGPGAEGALGYTRLRD
jgi:hypothetical protein